MLENIKLLYNFKSVKNSIEETLDELGILSKINEPIFKLSVGEQQRVAIAKTKLKKPNLILADEPTAFLDSAN